MVSTSQPGGRQRRELIADKAICIIARDGVRALTHRAVDRAAGIPQGSTSYYARTRLALLELVVDTLAQRAIADAATPAASAPTAASETDLQPGIAELANAIAALINRLASRRDDMRARYALILELDDGSELRQKLTTQSPVHAINQQVTAMALTQAGLPHSERHVEELLALTDALVFQQIAIDHPPPPEPILASYLHGIAVSTHQPLA